MSLQAAPPSQPKPPMPCGCGAPRLASSSSSWILLHYNLPPVAKPRILIIDDQEEVRDAFSRALALDGYETHTAESADSAMAAVEAMEPDAILLDFVMPKVDGLVFLRRLRETKRRTPVAVITGKSDVTNATVREMIHLGAEI